MRINKKCNITKLKEELESAGFNIKSLGSKITEDVTYVDVELDETETKDPTTIVNAHIYTAPLTADEIQTSCVKSEIEDWWTGLTAQQRTNLKNSGLLPLLKALVKKVYFKGVTLDE